MTEKELTNRTRILFVIDSLRFGGAERQLVELIKGIDKNRFEVCLCVLDEVDGGFTAIVKEIGVAIYCARRRFGLDILPILTISRLIRRNRIDVVHAFLTLGALFGVIAAMLSRTPVICSGIRDGKDASPVLALQKKIEARLSDIFVSNSLAGLTNRFRRLKPHFRVVYNGMDFTRFENNGTDPSALRRDLCLHDFDHIVGMVASLSKHKDQGTLLRAAPLILEKLPNTGFLMIGDGSEREKLAGMARSLEIDRNVVFVGYRSDVDRIYPLMNVSVLMTKSDVILEGISNSIIESMANGIPVIASSGGGTDEVIQHMQNSILVEPHNEAQLAHYVIQLLSDKGTAMRIGERAARDVRERFGLERYVSEYIHLYDYALGKTQLLQGQKGR